MEREEEEQTEFREGIEKLSRFCGKELEAFDAYKIENRLVPIKRQKEEWRTLTTPGVSF